LLPRITAHPSGLLVLALSATTGAALLRRGRREATPFLALAGGLLAYLVVGAYVLPWYAAWVLPLLCLVPSRPMQVLVVVQSLIVSCAYEYQEEARLDDLDRLLRLSIPAAQLVALAASLALVGSSVLAPILRRRLH